jgi:crossover junction endodeoxyribonuclease RuvC
MIVLGLDPGTAIVGWGVIDTGPSHDVSKAVCLAYDCIITDKGLTDSQRLLAIDAGLDQLLTRYTPDLVSVEKLFFAKNQTTVMTVSQARGVLLLGIEKHGLPLVEFTPLQVKQALTGYGKAEKAQIQNMVKLMLRLPGIPKPDDAADALAIAITAAQTKRY